MEILPLSISMNVEVCVSANKCSDSTHSFLKAMECEYSDNFKVRYHDEILTIDQNMICAIGLADADYIFPLGDDDFISKESILSILELISCSCHDLILLSCIHTDSFLKRVRPHLPKNLSGATFTCPAVAFSQLWSFMPFGSFLFSSQCFDFSFSARYMGTSHAYSGVVWDSLAKKKALGMTTSIYCMSNETVLLRGADKTWGSNKALILYFEIPLWFNLVSINKIYWDVANIALREYQNKLLSFRAILLEYYGARDYALLKNLPILNIRLSHRFFLRLFAALPRELLAWFFVFLRK